MQVSFSRHRREGNAKRVFACLFVCLCVCVCLFVCLCVLVSKKESLIFEFSVS